MSLLGYDIGSSSVKASLVDAQTGKCVASSFYPKSEAAIVAVKPGWAEQEPASWWENLKLATADVMSASAADPGSIKAIGISYQMHGLVCVDKDGRKRHGKQGRLKHCGIIVVDEIDRIAVNIAEKLGGNCVKLGLGITGRGTAHIP